MPPEPVCGVYAIVQSQTGQAYIGCSTDIGARWRWHLQLLAQGKHHSPLLQDAWKSFGRSAFGFTILQIAGPKTDLRALETAWMRQYPGRLFNAMPENRHGASSRAAMSLAQKAAWVERRDEGTDRLSLAERQEIARTTRLWARRPAVRARMREIALENGAASVLRTPEAVEANRQALLGMPKSPRHRASMSARHRSGSCRCHPGQSQRGGEG